MKLKIKAGTTSRIIRIKIVNSTTGAPMTGLVFNSSGLVAYYIRNGQSSETPITLVTATVGTFTSGGFKEINSTTMPGYYELGVPNACITTGATDVAIRLGGVSNMKDVDVEIELDAVDYQSSTNFGLSNLDLKTSSIPLMSARYNQLMLETDISYVTSTSNFSLRSGITASQQFNDCMAVFLWSGDISFGARQNVGQIKDTFSSNNSITTYSAPQGALVSVSSGDIVRIYRQFPANVYQWNGNNVVIPSMSGTPDVNAYGLEGQRILYSGYIVGGAGTAYNLDALANGSSNTYVGGLLVPMSGGLPLYPGAVITSYGGSNRSVGIRPLFPVTIPSGTPIQIIPIGMAGIAALSNFSISTSSLSTITNTSPVMGVNAVGLESQLAIATGTIISAGPTSVILDSSVSSVDGIFHGGFLVVMSGGLPLQPGRPITSYTGSTRQVIVAPQFSSIPTSGLTAVILPAGTVGIGSVSVPGSTTFQGVSLTAPMFGANVASVTSGNPANLADVYYADIKQYRDKTNSRDEYSAIWFKNGGMTSSGDVTNSRISVYSGTNGGSVFINQNLPYTAANIPTMYRAESTSILASGLPYFVTVSGTIDGATRVWSKIVGRHDNIG